MTDQPLDADGLSSLMDGADRIRNLFLSMVATGFTEDQALYLTAQLVGVSIMAAGEAVDEKKPAEDGTKDEGP